MLKGFGCWRAVWENHGLREKGCRIHKAVGVPEHSFFAKTVFKDLWTKAKLTRPARKKAPNFANC
jgi:hypothetical protein